MRLFIAEKPSVAKAIAAELGVENATGACLNCRNGDIVTWCFGHLLEQAEPDAYLPDDVPKTKKGKKIWRMEDLPIFPKEWKLLPKEDAGVKKQLKQIGRLIKTADILVNAGDPDREGQLLVDEVIAHFGSKKPVQRFWVSAVDPATIRKGLLNLKVNANFAGMRDAALGRSRADWLLGMNLSRAYTLANQTASGKGELMAVGRVQTPTLTMVARRDYAVKNFKPLPYLSITASCQALGTVFTAKWRPRENQPGLDEEGRLLIDLDKGRALVARLSCITQAAVIAAETKRRQLPQPKACSLADIQIEASRLFGYTAEETLNTCQSLYETHKVTSYPRTDCSFLPESQHADAPKVLAAIAHTFSSTAKAVSMANPSIKSPTFNDQKITAHHGIVPVANVGHWDRFNEKEKNLYRLIAQHYLAQFFPPHEYDATEIVIDVGGEAFVAKGNVVVKKGWKVLYGTRESDDEFHPDETSDTAEEPQRLPPLVKEECVTVAQVSGRERQTKPPSFYTEGTLIAAMENIWRSFENPALQARLKEAGGIGTPATRAAIIAELKRKKYLEVQGKILHCSESGRALLKKVSPKIRSAEMTAQFEEKLKLVESGELTVEGFTADYEDFILDELRKVQATA